MIKSFNLLKSTVLLKGSQTFLHCRKDEASIQWGSFSVTQTAQKLMTFNRKRLWWTWLCHCVIKKIISKQNWPKILNMHEKSQSWTRRVCRRVNLNRQTLVDWESHPFQKVNVHQETEWAPIGYSCKKELERWLFGALQKEDMTCKSLLIPWVKGKVRELQNSKPIS
jgi:hypothetical protein